jgi:hypothetical protein
MVAKNRNPQKWSEPELRLLAEGVVRGERPKDIIARFDEKFGRRAGTAQRLSHIRRGTSDKLKNLVESVRADEKSPKATATRKGGTSKATGKGKSPKS